MRGVTFVGNRQVAHIEVLDPTPGVGEVVLEIKASGLCGSDLHHYRSPTGFGGPFPPTEGPIIAGHEPCGVVVAVGLGVAANEARVGDRVMVHHYWGCGACDECRSGWTQLCTVQSPVIYGSNAHGAHAPYMKVPARTLVPLAPELSFVAGATISCGTGTAYFVLRRMQLSGRDTIAIFGQGPVGLATTQLAVAQGARVVALDPNRERLQRAQAFGANVLVDPSCDDALDAIREFTKGGQIWRSKPRGPRPPVPWRFAASVYGALWAWSESVATSASVSTWALADAAEAYRVFDRQIGGKGVFVTDPAGA